MLSTTTEGFRKAYAKLPESIKKAAKKNYSVWQNNPGHKSLKYKKISKTKEIYSIRISKGWRALGLKNKETMIWFWVGSHNEYDKLIKSMK